MAISQTQDKLIMACEHGVRIILVDPTRKELSVTSETYLEDKLVSQVFEQDSQTFVASVFNQNGYLKINRITGAIDHIKRSISNKAEANISLEEDELNNEFCTDLKPLPGFDSKLYPFMITRTSNYINLLDLRKNTSY